MKTRGGGGMQIESCYGRLLRLRPNLRHLNMTREPTPFSRRGKCEFNVKRQARWGATKRSGIRGYRARAFIFLAVYFGPPLSSRRNFLAEVSVA